MLAWNLGLASGPYLYARIFEMVRKSIWFLFFVFSASACLDEPDCYRLNNYWVGISFKKIADSTADTVNFTMIRIVEPPLQVTGDTTLRGIVVALNYFENETTFLFDSAETTKMLRLGYNSQVQFVSENCGERFVLSNLRILEHSFDSVRVLLTDPARDGQATHLEIYQ
jgi:hypothetical protein